MLFFSLGVAWRRGIFAGVSHALAFSPGGHLFVEPDEQAEPKLNTTAATRLSESFTASGARGFEILASELLHEPLPPTFGFWRGLARRYFTALCHNPNQDNAAGLIVDDTRQHLAMPTAAADEWSDLDAADRWWTLALSWLKTPMYPSMAGHTDANSKPLPALGYGVNYTSEAAGQRRSVHGP